MQLLAFIARFVSLLRSVYCMSRHGMWTLVAVYSQLTRGQPKRVVIYVHALSHGSILWSKEHTIVKHGFGLVLRKTFTVQKFDTVYGNSQTSYATYEIKSLRQLTYYICIGDFEKFVCISIYSVSVLSLHMALW